MSILVVMEQRGGEWNRMSWETLAAAQQMAADLKTEVNAAILGHGGHGGHGVDALSTELAGKQLAKVYAVEHELLQEYTPDAYSSALRQLIARAAPDVVLFPHTYQVRDFLPKLATSLGKVAVSDVVAHRADGAQLVLVRQLFQGKVNADVRFAAAGPNFASLQAGAYRADQLADLAGPVTAPVAAPVERFAPSLNATEIRTKPLDRFRESARAVDLSAAELIVAVGRGIREAENIALVQELATALGAELAASRPICDAGWLPMERQVGSSGQTVSPKMYMAIGISGAIQHLVGMKGARTIVAINKDANAPIFEVADYGIVGDLFQVIPELVAACKR
jgi:electron transfer flavoprotein alpha subunit